MGYWIFDVLENKGSDVICPVSWKFSRSAKTATVNEVENKSALKSTFPGYRCVLMQAEKARQHKVQCAKFCLWWPVFVTKSAYAAR